MTTDAGVGLSHERPAERQADADADDGLILRMFFPMVHRGTLF
jgi:hypothetical protein